MTEPTVDGIHDHNRQIIETFRANGGDVGAPFGSHLLLLTSTGARSGKPRTSPVFHTRDGDRFLIYASKAGADTNPDWYHNLRAHPRATIEVGTDTFEVDATELTGAERDEKWAAVKLVAPGFGDYERRTSRTIPVVALTPVR